MNEKERSELASELRHNRKAEKEKIEKASHYNRTAWGYTYELGGVEASFDYVRNLPVKTILDLGTGTGKALAEFKKSPEGNGLNFIGQAIKNNKAIVNNLGSGGYRITPVESLKTIPDKSVGAVISVYGGMMYSRHYDSMADSISRILIDDGLVKTSIPFNESPGENIDPYLYQFMGIYHALKRRGLSVTKEVLDKESTIPVGVILAIKNRDKQDLVEELMEKDLNTRN